MNRLHCDTQQAYFLGKLLQQDRKLTNNNTVTIWHNPRCSKSRLALKLLRDRGYEPAIFSYLDGRLTSQMVRDVLEKLKLEPRELMRKTESRYKELRLKSVSDHDELIDALAYNPILVERPIVINGNQAVIGRPPEKALSIL